MSTMTDKLTHLTRIAEMNDVANYMEKAHGLAVAITRAAFPNDQLRAPGWLYAEGGKVGLNADTIGRALGVGTGEIVSAGTYLPDMDRGGLFIGFPWDVFTGQGGESKDDWETTVAVSIEAIPSLLLELDFENVPASHQETFGEIMSLAEELKAAMTRVLSA